MGTFTWSKRNEWWHPLCTNSYKPESLATDQNRGEGCNLCLEPSLSHLVPQIDCAGCPTGTTYPRIYKIKTPFTCSGSIFPQRQLKSWFNGDDGCTYYSNHLLTGLNLDDVRPTKLIAGGRVDVQTGCVWTQGYGYVRNKVGAAWQYTDGGRVDQQHSPVLCVEVAAPSIYIYRALPTLGASVWDVNNTLYDPQPTVTIPAIPWAWEAWHLILQFVEISSVWYAQARLYVTGYDIDSVHYKNCGAGNVTAPAQTANLVTPPTTGTFPPNAIWRGTFDCNDTSNLSLPQVGGIGIPINTLYPDPLILEGVAA
jgi:hypothetical protein